jgi:hypothetical protein
MQIFSNELGSLRTLAGGRPHSTSVRTPNFFQPSVRVSYLPPLVGPIGDPSTHYAIIVGNDAKAITTQAGYEKPNTVS